MFSQLYTILLAFASGHYSMSHILKYLRQIRNSIIHVALQCLTQPPGVLHSDDVNSARDGGVLLLQTLLLSDI